MTIERDVVRLELRRVKGCATAPAIERLNIVEFATTILGLGLYPMQALLLKLITLETGLLTEWDHETLVRLGNGYRRIDDANGPRYAGTEGMPPDVLERIDYCRSQGFWSFRQVVLILGRRASKSLIGEIVALWEVWNLLALGNPQTSLGIPPKKRISVAVFSTTRSSASRDQFGDIVALLQDATGFAPFVDYAGTDAIRLFTPAQLQRGAQPGRQRGIVEVSAVSTTGTAARGPAVLALLLDEFAHVTGAGSTSDAWEIARSAEPALTQFRREAIEFIASSPASMIGRCYEAHLEACAINAVTGKAAHPAMLTLQLPSWRMYDDWNIAHTLEMYPGGPCFAEIPRPIILESDPEVVKAAERDPWTYRVEYRAQWASSIDAYLDPAMVERMFGSFQGHQLEMQSAPSMGRVYAMHIDPSAVANNTALLIAHVQFVDGEPHVLVDVIRYWSPTDFADGVIDYRELAREAALLIRRFQPARVSIDQFPGPALGQMIDEELTPPQHISGLESLRAHMNRVRVERASPGEKAARYETLKLLLNDDRLHAPYHPLLHDELLMLERRGDKISAPTSGPVTTDDGPDALTWVIKPLLSGTLDLTATFANASRTGSRRATSSPRPGEPAFGQFPPLRLDNDGHRWTRRRW